MTTLDSSPTNVTASPIRGLVYATPAAILLWTPIIATVAILLALLPG